MLLLVETSCKKEEAQAPIIVPSTNYIKYNGMTAPISMGILTNNGSAGSNSFNTDLYLYNGFTLHESNNQMDSLSGTGNLLYFSMFSSQGEKLDSGDYNFDPDYTLVPKTFAAGVVFLNYNIQIGSGIMSVVDGVVSVISNDTIYEINFSGYDEEGSVVSMHYKGELKYFDESKKGL